jgi:hypothetical protein
LAEKLKLTLRPHHLLCAKNFIGKGYSPEFVENFKQILARLEAGEEFEITNNHDAICAACPNLQNNLCQSQTKIETLDKNHSKLLGVIEGNKLTWQEAQELIRNKIADINFQQLCSGCEWVIICQNNNIKL